MIGRYPLKLGNLHMDLTKKGVDQQKWNITVNGMGFLGKL
jgi:hypothetical protein